MNTVVAVLIGGPADGRRVAINPAIRELFVVAQRLNCTSHYQAEVVPVAELVHKERYVEIHGAGDLRVYAHDSVPYHIALRVLIEGYRPEIIK